MCLYLINDFYNFWSKQRLVYTGYDTYTLLFWQKFSENLFWVMSAGYTWSIDPTAVKVVYLFKKIILLQFSLIVYLFWWSHYRRPFAMSRLKCLVYLFLVLFNKNRFCWRRKPILGRVIFFCYHALCILDEVIGWYLDC